MYRDQALYWAGRARYEWGLIDPTQPSPHYLTADAYFEQLFAEHPGSVYEDNAYYYYGLSAFRRADYPLAVVRLDVVRTQLAPGPFVDNAWYYIGYAHYLSQDYANALLELDAFLLTIPVSKYRDNALYIAGRSHYQTGVAGVSADPSVDYLAAITRFTELLVEAPASAYADNGAYFAGRAHLRLANLGVDPAPNRLAAIGFFDLVIADYPTSGYADNAYRWKVEAQVDLGDCAAAAQTAADLGVAFPNSTQLPAAQAAAAGC